MAPNSVYGHDPLWRKEKEIHVSLTQNEREKQNM